MTHKIRVYTATVETKHGIDSAFVANDPILERDEGDIIDELMEKLNYTENEDNDDYWGYPGHCDGVGAYFDYNYEDLEIPESIVNRILKGE